MPTSVNPREVQSCCSNGYKAPCRCQPATCTPGECVHVQGKCPMHCGCAQHGHQR